MRVSPRCNVNFGSISDTNETFTASCLSICICNILFVCGYRAGFGVVRLRCDHDVAQLLVLLPSRNLAIPGRALVCTASHKRVHRHPWRRASHLPQFQCSLQIFSSAITITTATLVTAQRGGACKRDMPVLLILRANFSSSRSVEVRGTA